MHFINQFLSYTRPERLGILVLIGTCTLLAVASAWMLPAVEPFPEVEIGQFLVAQPDTVKHSPAQRQAPIAGYTDPNQPSVEQLRAFALPERTIAAWLAYLNKGGRFSDSTALAKFRALPEADRLRIMPYLVFPKPRIAPVAPSSRPARLFSFDPNTATEQELLALALPERTIKTLLKYRLKGGQFRQPSDLKRIYGLQEADYQRLLPYISISYPPKADTLPFRYKQPSRDVVVYINQATPEEWAELYGIGPVLSDRIVKFREKLGGFYRIDQVADTYGLPDTTWQHIHSHLRLEVPHRTMRFDTLTVEGLAAHPYLRWKQARVLIAYRDQHQPITSADQLNAVRAIPPNVLEKLVPYLSFN